MSKISRRGLFGLLGGAAVVPLIKPASAEAEPVAHLGGFTGTYVRRGDYLTFVSNGRSVASISVSAGTTHYSHFRSGEV